MDILLLYKLRLWILFIVLGVTLSTGSGFVSFGLSQMSTFVSALRVLIPNVKCNKERSLRSLFSRGEGVKGCWLNANTSFQ